MRRILIVNGDVDAHVALKRALVVHAAEWDIGFCTNVEHALRMLRHLSFDAVVSDVCLDGPDGFELLHQIASGSYGFLPVSLVTETPDSVVKREALRMGASDVLTKPLSIEDLVARIRSMLHVKRMHDEMRRRNEALEQSIKVHTSELERSRLEVVLRLAKAAEFRDQETGSHIVRVGLYSGAIARHHNKAHSVADDIMHAAPLHDIGKIGLPDTILTKQGPLSPEERIAMQEHCRIGARILMEQDGAMQALLEHSNSQTYSHPFQRTSLLAAGALVALTHHERWDGRGYPHGLSGLEIPIEGRIVAVADVYDALRSKRSYKDAMCLEATLRILQQESGRQFDPSVIEAMEQALPEMLVIEQRLPYELPDQTIAAIQEKLAA